MIDNSNECEDVQLVIHDEAIIIRQYEDEFPNIIILSHCQWQELLVAIHQPEGAGTVISNL